MSILPSPRQRLPMGNFLLAWTLTLAVVPGCSQMTSLLSDPFESESLYAQEEKYRHEYLTTNSPEALRWLTANRLKNGMSKTDVDGVIGQEGEREFNDQAILSEGGLYRSDDVVYRWGPDSDGKAYLFVFRDGKLVNVENFGEELRDASTPRVGFSLSSDDL